MGKLTILKSGEWDLLAVAAASVIGIIGHILGVIPEHYIISLILLLLALHALHDISHDMKFDLAFQMISGLDSRMESLDPGIKLITKDHFKEGQNLALRNQGAFVWFNTPMSVMRSQEIFDTMLKPAIESRDTKTIEFVLNPTWKDFFDREVWPKIQEVKGNEKVSYPIFTQIKEGLGFKMVDTSREIEAREFHLTFLDRPFTIARTNEDGRKVVHPKIILHVTSKSELAKELKELYIHYKMG